MANEPIYMPNDRSAFLGILGGVQQGFQNFQQQQAMKAQAANEQMKARAEMQLRQAQMADLQDQMKNRYTDFSKVQLIDDAINKGFVDPETGASLKKDYTKKALDNIDGPSAGIQIEILRKQMMGAQSPQGQAQPQPMGAPVSSYDQAQSMLTGNPPGWRIPMAPGYSPNLQTQLPSQTKAESMGAQVQDRSVDPYAPAPVQPQAQAQMQEQYQAPARLPILNKSETEALLKLRGQKVNADMLGARLGVQKDTAQLQHEDKILGYAAELAKAKSQQEKDMLIEQMKVTAQKYAADKGVVKAQIGANAKMETAKITAWARKGGAASKDPFEANIYKQIEQTSKALDALDKPNMFGQTPLPALTEGARSTYQQKIQDLYNKLVEYQSGKGQVKKPPAPAGVVSAGASGPVGATKNIYVHLKDGGIGVQIAPGQYRRASQQEVQEAQQQAQSP